ncbi:hypothetical protein DFR50_11465 [Roseiarcus fermentans]|uniref:Uncharacterized protein n=1 Tax=Roseiarcus fermentans TaxID=1473586 RepID=A0A366FDR7_9HYPH|nr:hypothetical protein DFR50_11465 [Roseiarcus fermentans]
MARTLEKSASSPGGGRPAQALAELRVDRVGYQLFLSFFFKKERTNFYAKNQQVTVRNEERREGG